ncbi:S24 family peptidase [uncultured Martelella sp.]|uniref:S24 family peptidase n=1 Tax=uncultured Martelella sp. TaxID=392331 RepID=UPI0029C6900D|nr:S24 family peptidase [uncultured Martelella sp.]
MTNRQEQSEREFRAERLKEARQRAGFGGVKSAASQFGWNVNNYKAHESGRNGFGVADGRRYARAFNVSFHWLYLGEGAPDTAEHQGTVPLVSFISAGKLAEPNGYVESDSHVEIPLGGLPSGDWIALRVEGDSMDLFSPPGSIIFINRREREAVDGAFYVVATDDGEATYKRYRKDPERLEPESTNREHQTIYPSNALTIIGRVRRTLFDFPA